MATLEDKILQQIVVLSQEVLYKIFVYLHKSYDVLNWGHDLVILEGYGVGLQICQHLTQYWNQETMAARDSGYYGDPFQGSRGVTQGDPLSPRIFNVIVDAIVCHWIRLVA